MTEPLLPKSPADCGALFFLHSEVRVVKSIGDCCRHVSKGLVDIESDFTKETPCRHLEWAKLGSAYELHGQKGFVVVKGKISRKYFEERVYGMNEMK